MRHPPLQRLFAVDAIGPMAVARSQGGIFWAHPYGDHRGILVFDRLAAAVAWQEEAVGYPFVVAEFGRGCCDMDLAEPIVLEIDHPEPYRAWVYTDAIIFGDVRWHLHQQVAEILGGGIQDPRAVTAEITAQYRQEPQDLVQGTITLDINGIHNG